MKTNWPALGLAVAFAVYLMLWLILSLSVLLRFYREAKTEYAELEATFAQAPRLTDWRWLR